MIGTGQRLRNRVAVVTGGGSGIGAAVCRRLAAEGATVGVVDIDRVAAERVARDLDGGSGLVLQVDLADAEAITGLAERVREHVGAVHVLVNNAGILRRSRIQDTGDADWATQIAVNLRAPALVARALLPLLRAEGAAVVNISSEGAWRPRSAQWVYDSSKAGLGALTRVMAVEFAEHGIRANEVAPGWIVTEMHFGSAVDPQARKHELEQMSNDQCILGRLGRPEEVAAAVAFLASDDSSYLTATTLHVDGGMGLG